MIKRIVYWIKKMKEERRRRRVAKFLFEHSLDSYFYWIGIQKEGREKNRNETE